MENNASVIEQPKQIKEPKLSFYNGDLFHGAHKEFDFDKGFFENIEKRQQLEDVGGSNTLGNGLYFTDSSESGNKYSVQRKSDKETPVVYFTKVPDCKFLDFRSENGNLPVPKDVVEKWIEKLKILADQKYSDVTTETPRHTVVENGQIKRRVVNMHARGRDHMYQYIGFLDEYKNRGTLDLREMLGTSPAPKNDSKFDGSLPFAKEGELFRKFVVNDLGYDGIIYNEGLEWGDSDNGGLDSYVIYNLEKIKELKRV